MLDVKEKIDVPSRCGIDCSNCNYLEQKMCTGCTNIDKPFWADACPVKNCCESKEIACCGKCDDFPCEQLQSFAYDKDQGDNGLRIENCRKWCSKEN